MDLAAFQHSGGETIVEREGHRPHSAMVRIDLAYALAEGASLFGPTYSPGGEVG